MKSKFITRKSAEKNQKAEIGLIRLLTIVGCRSRRSLFTSKFINVPIFGRERLILGFSFFWPALMLTSFQILSCGNWSLGIHPEAIKAIESISYHYSNLHLVYGFHNVLVYWSEYWVLFGELRIKVSSFLLTFLQ